MMTALDPFQLVRDVRLKNLITRESIGSITVIGPGSPTVGTACFGGPVSLTDVYRYSNFGFSALSAPFYDCNQFDLTVTGQTTGTKVNFGGGPQLAALGFAWPDCVEQTCFFWNGSIFQRMFAFTATPIPNFFSYSSALGFQNGEPVDLSFPPAPKLPITQIVFRTSTTVWIDCVDHRLKVDSWCDLDGTDLYDGTYEVLAVDSVDRFAVTVPYIEDIEGGTVQANFLIVV